MFDEFKDMKYVYLKGSFKLLGIMAKDIIRDIHDCAVFLSNRK